MDGEPETIDLLRDLEGTEELTMRLRVPLWITPDTDDASMEAWLALRDARGRLWRGGVAKFFADGVIDAGTAWLEAPDTHGEGLTPFWPDPERMAALDRALRRRGLPARDAHDRRRRRALHARRLRAGAAAGAATGSSTSRRSPTTSCRRSPRAGVTASMQPVHLAALRGDGTGNWNERLGPERAARAFRMRDLLDAGALLALGSDWPVADADPRLGLAAAQLRRLPSEPSCRAPDQALTARGGAGRLHARARRWSRARPAWPGASAWGMRADLTGLLEDPVARCPTLLCG